MPFNPLPAVVMTTLAFTFSALSAPSGSEHQSLKQTVFDTEKAFAATMAARDFSAFSAFIDEEAVFFNGTEPLRGKAQVLNQWQGYFETEQAPFSWSPENVEVLPSGTLAHSSGPVYRPDGSKAAEFNSVWRRNEAGQWKIIFDKGATVCQDKASGH